MRVGFVGTGGHASASIYPCLRPAGLELVAICSRRLERAEAAARAWGVEHAFDDVAAMTASTELDAVLVCVQPEDYRPLVAHCLEAGLPVFCEKPGAASAAEAADLAALSEATGTPVVVGYMKRFAPAYRRAHEIVHGDGFGPLSLGTFTFAMGQGWDADLETYLLENPVHHLDLARFLLGEIEGIEANVAELPGFGHAVVAIARAASGAVCSFNLCTTASFNQRNEYVEIYGRGAAVWVENVDTCVHRPADPPGGDWQGPEAERPAQLWRPNYTVPVAANTTAVTLGFLPELQHFRAVASEGAASASDMASAAATLALAERLCELLVGER